MEKVLISGKVKAIGMYALHDHPALIIVAHRSQQLFSKDVRLPDFPDPDTHGASRLEQLLTTAVITPAVNQVE